MYGHCLQRLYKIDEALTKYTEALDLNRYASFERCQRAFLYWTQNDWTKALEDVQQLGVYIDEKWFLPYGADILWKAGRLKEALEWLDAAVKDGPGSYGLPLLLRGLLRFHQGRISESLRIFDSCLIWRNLLSPIGFTVLIASTWRERCAFRAPLTRR